MAGKSPSPRPAEAAADAVAPVGGEVPAAPAEPSPPPAPTPAEAAPSNAPAADPPKVPKASKPVAAAPKEAVAAGAAKPRAAPEAPRRPGPAALTPGLPPRPGRCAASGRFTFHKDTCCQLAPMAAKLAAVREVDSPFRLYNANVETLLPCLAQGWHGFSGISANFYPHMHAFLCAKGSGGADLGADAEACAAVQDFLTLAEVRRPAPRLSRRGRSWPLAPQAVCPQLSRRVARPRQATVCVNYPASAKLYLGLLSPDLEPLAVARCRKAAAGKPMGRAMFAEHQVEALAAMDRLGRRVAAEFGIKVASL